MLMALMYSYQGIDNKIDGEQCRYKYKRSDDVCNNFELSVVFHNAALLSLKIINESLLKYSFVVKVI